MNATTALRVLNTLCYPAAGQYVKPSEKSLRAHGGQKLASGQDKSFWVFQDGSNLTVGASWADIN